jgi:hypothetical protein
MLKSKGLKVSGKKSDLIARLEGVTPQSSLTPSPGAFTRGLLFDCDGVIIETESIHLQAYNEAWKRNGLVNPVTNEPVFWSVEYYGELGRGSEKTSRNDISSDGSFTRFIFARNIILTPSNQSVVQLTFIADMLQNKVGGGKNKMRYYYDETSSGVWPNSNGRETPPTTDDEKQALLDKLQDEKTIIYQELVR